MASIEADVSVVQAQGGKSLSTSLPPAPEVPAPTSHDSKDFVEHLRTVHFSLMVVCLGLLVIALSPSPRAISTAIEQLNQIAEVTSDANWDKTRLQRTAERLVGNSPDCIGSKSKPFDIMLGVRFTVEIVGRNWVVSRLPSSASAGPQGMNEDAFVVYSIAPPKNLAEFREVWDWRSKIYCPLSRGQYAWLWAVTEGLQRFPLKEMPATKDKSPIYLTLMRTGPDPDEDKYPQIPEDFVYYDFGGDVHRRIGIQASGGGNIDIALRETLLLDFPKYKWIKSDFKDAFYELNGATEGFQDLDFPHLRQILRQSEKNAKEVFEAFGVKFPIESTTRWGVIVILSIQLYLWLHMAEYRKRNIPPGDIAWLGSYTHPIPRIVFCATALLTPIGVMSFLSTKTQLVTSETWNLPVTLLALITSTGLAALTLADYIRTHRKPVRRT